MTTIAVIGLGLIGGSVLKKLKNTDYELIGVSRRQETINTAIEQGLISQGSIDISIVKDADIIFVCTPINKTVFTISEVAKIAKSEAVITDVASLKGFVIDFVNTSHEPINFIGGHPMAGTEHKGIDASFEGLFEGAKWVLTPSKWAKDEDLRELEEIIIKLGAKPITADPQEHDKAVALISHMPLFLSQALFSLVKNYPDKKTGELAMQLAASGFRDMTRIAATNPELAADMLFENKTNVFSSIKELVGEYSCLEKELVEDKDNFLKISQELAESRKEMYSVDGKNIYS